MYFVWITEQTATFGLHNIMCFVLKRGVYCAVWTGSLNKAGNMSCLKG